MNRERDDELMGRAIECARRAGQDGNVPVGAVIVVPDADGAEIAIEGWNQRRSSSDPTAHAEIMALREAGPRLGTWRVEGTLYVTQEPCPMCAGALVNARIERLVYGCTNPKAGAVHTLYEIVTDSRLNHRMEVTGGVRAEECAELLSSFFESLRKA